MSDNEEKSLIDTREILRRFTPRNDKPLQTRELLKFSCGCFGYSS